MAARGFDFSFAERERHTHTHTYTDSHLDTHTHTHTDTHTNQPKETRIVCLDDINKRLGADLIVVVRTPQRHRAVVRILVAGLVRVRHGHRLQNKIRPALIHREREREREREPGTRATYTHTRTHL